MAHVDERDVGNEIWEAAAVNPSERVAAGDLDDDGKPKRTGTMWTTAAHIITAVIGAGILSLPWGIAQVGWIAGVGILLSFALITLYTSNLLADCYRSPDPVTGNRNYTYMRAVKAILGGKVYAVGGWSQYILLSGLTIGYTITTSNSMVAISKSHCLRKRGQNAPCKFSNNPFMVGVGLAEILLSQIPNFHDLSWLSIIAATMSFGYALIGIILSLERIMSGQGGRTSLSGIEVGGDISQADKVWRIFSAMGDIAFASSYSLLLFDIQDTLKSSPPENKVMKRANLLAIVTMTSFFTMCSCLGYAAFGNQAPGNMLAGFGIYKPFWLIDLANVMVVVHLIGAYQVICQPVFRVVETWAQVKWPTSNFVTREYPIKVLVIEFGINYLRLIWRTIFAITVTLLAMVMPFFNAMIALLGSLAYWPFVAYFPVRMFIAQKKIRKRTIQWVGLQMLSLICLLVSMAAAIGAIQGLKKGLSAAKPFKCKE